MKSSYRCVLIATAALVAGSCTGQAEAPQPRLIVQITFDQLRGDLLERYRPALTGGFKRVLDEGWWAQQGDAAHGLTVSFPGHATLATGMFPSHHGLTANEWWQEVDGRWRSVSVVEDKRYKMASGGTGVSLWQMTASTLADWVKAASPQSRTVAIGSDSAIVYGGKRPDAMFWFDPEAGGYTTSTYYGARRPAWIAALNRQLADLPREWALQVPPQWRSLATHAQRCPPPRYAWADPAYDVVHASIVPCNADILGALRGKPAETTGEDNLKTMELVFAAYESAKTNRVVSFPSGTGLSPLGGIA